MNIKNFFLYLLAMALMLSITSMYFYFSSAVPEGTYSIPISVKLNDKEYAGTLQLVHENKTYSLLEIESDVIQLRNYSKKDGLESQEIITAEACVIGEKNDNWQVCEFTIPQLFAKTFGISVGERFKCMGLGAIALNLFFFAASLSGMLYVKKLKIYG